MFNNFNHLELEAYASVITAFRAQGDLNKEKRKLLQELANYLRSILYYHVYFIETFSFSAFQSNVIVLKYDVLLMMRDSTQSLIIFLDQILLLNGLLKEEDWLHFCQGWFLKLHSLQWQTQWLIFRQQKIYQ